MFRAAKVLGPIGRPARLARLLAFAIALSSSAARAGEHEPLTEDGQWLPVLPSLIDAHSAVYDPVRDRMIVFGGRPAGDFSRGSNEVWALSLNTLGWSRLYTVGAPPSPRFGHTAIYDPVRDRMLVFGGMTGYNDLADGLVWSLTLSETPQWSQLATVGSFPLRADHVAIYDSVGDRMVVFGGRIDWSTYFNDVWVLSLDGTPIWTEIVTGGDVPPGRYGAAAIYDPARNQMVVCGGRPEGIYGEPDLNVWTLSLGEAPSWTHLGAFEWGNVYGHTAIHDPLRDRIVIHAGQDNGEVPERFTLALTLSEPYVWSELSGSVAPIPRYRHTAIYDPPRDRMIVLAGIGQYEAINYFADLWAFELEPQLWAPLSPPPRQDHAAVYDAVGDRMLVFGGDNHGDGCHGLGELFGDIWAFKLAGRAWSRLAATGTPPDAVLDIAVIHDPVRNRLLVQGHGRTWILALDSNEWSEPAMVGAPPLGVRPAGVYDAQRDRFLVYQQGSVWALDLDEGSEWAELAVSGPRPGSGYATATLDTGRDRLVVHEAMGATWSLSLANPIAWEELETTGLPPGAGFFASIYDPVRDRLVVTDGGAFSEAVTRALSFGDLTWRTLGPVGGRSDNRDGHSAIYDPIRDQMVVHAGAGPNSRDYSGCSLSDTWRLVWGGSLAVTEAPAPSASIGPAFPNPARGFVSLRIDLPAVALVEVGVYDLAGRLVHRQRAGTMAAGLNVLSWDARSSSGERVPAGMYFVRVNVGGETHRRSIALVP